MYLNFVVSGWELLLAHCFELEFAEVAGVAFGGLAHVWMFGVWNCVSTCGGGIDEQRDLLGAHRGINNI